MDNAHKGEEAFVILIEMDTSRGRLQVDTELIVDEVGTISQPGPPRSEFTTSVLLIQVVRLSFQSSGLPEADKARRMLTPAARQCVYYVKDSSTISRSLLQLFFAALNPIKMRSSSVERFNDRHIVLG